MDEDNPGTIGFEDRHQKVKKKDNFAYITVVRSDGCDGAIQCRCQTEVVREINNQATEFTDFLPYDERLKFEHGETEKVVKIELVSTAAIDEKPAESAEAEEKSEKDGSDSEESEEMDTKTLVFQIKLDNPQPQGTKISKRNICFVEIVPDEDSDNAVETQQAKMLEYIL